MASVWVPTHEIIWRPAQGREARALIMFVPGQYDGPAPTETEHKARREAAWHRDYRERWTHRGQATPKGVPGEIWIRELRLSASRRSA